MLTNDCMPAEFEKQSAILLGCNELLPYHPRVLVELAAALIDKFGGDSLVEMKARHELFLKMAKER